MVSSIVLPHSEYILQSFVTVPNMMSPSRCWWIIPICTRCAMSFSHFHCHTQLMHILGGPISKLSYDELTKNLWKSLTYEKTWDKHVIIKNLAENFGRSYAKLITTLQVSYGINDITGILWKLKICGKWCHSGNPVSRGCYWSNTLS